MTHDDTDALGALLTAAAPPAPRTSADTHTALAREVVTTERGRQGLLRRSRRHRRAVAVATAAAVLVPSGAWAAQHLLAQTGSHGDPVANRGLQDGSELIDTCAGDFADYVATLTPRDLPAAPGHTWREYAAAEARSWADPGGCRPGQVGTAQESDLRLGVLSLASGDWGCVLVWATRDGDPAGAAEARSTMEDIRARSASIASVDGSAGAADPDAFLANSRLPQFTGCAR